MTNFHISFPNKFIIYFFIFSKKMFDELNKSNTNQDKLDADLNQSEVLETKEQTNDAMKNLEQKIKTKEETAELESIKKEVKKSNLEIDKIKLFFVDIWIDISDFDFDFMIDDYEVLVKKFGKYKIEDIIRIIKTNREKKDSQLQKDWVDQGYENILDIRSERSTAVSQIIFWDFEQIYLDKDNLSENIIQNIDIVQYFLNNYDKLDDDKKKKVKELLEMILAKFFEWKIIEIYEIQIDANGNITIRWKDKNGEDTVVVIDKNKIQLWENIQNKISDFISKIKSDSSNDDIWLSQINQKLNILWWQKSI